LVRPGHPRAISHLDGNRYNHGRHALAWSVVLPVDAAALELSSPMRDLERELREAPFADKIAWDLLARRRNRLHATICAGMGIGKAPAVNDDARQALRDIGPITVELRGLFSGTRNIGRLYLRVYPEKRSNTNALHLVQQALGRPTTDMYLLGLYNLTDDLTAEETHALDALLSRWWDQPLLTVTASSLWLLGSRDDLVLDTDPPQPLQLSEPTTNA
jgi:hypothetical protein